MPAGSAAAFEAFHNHAVRLRWDTLLKEAYVEGGASHPFVGAISFNRGKGWKAVLSMRTRFVAYDPPHVAAAIIVAPTGLFYFWGASMKHRDIESEGGGSELDYSFHIKLRPRWLLAPFDFIAARIFAWQTRRRFTAMAEYLKQSSKETE